MNEYILGIESSCDDTSVAVAQGRKILANVTANQDIHAEYGGVVPELASRAHQQNIVPVVHTALQRAGLKAQQLSGVAFTAGPGLLGSLLVGTSFAKSMALALDIPLIDVHHMEAHILAHLIENDHSPTPPFPFLCLTVSGGHTQLVKVHAADRFELLGQTLDDAAGEAFDKSAKILGLPYPGGPLIDRYAQMGNPQAFRFTRPVVPELNYSFSGLKTNILYFLQREMKKDPDFISKNRNDLCASIQHTIVSILMINLVKAARQHQLKHVAIAGGVSANSELRKQLTAKGRELHWQTYIPAMEYCTDNGAMIAVAGYFKFRAGQFSPLTYRPAARKPLSLPAQ